MRQANIVKPQPRAPKRSVEVRPASPGSLFQASLAAAQRHALGAHFTNQVDIGKVIEPTIVRPLRARIEQANTAAELRALRDVLRAFTVLDPACGGGDFLCLAYRALRRIEEELRAKIEARCSRCDAESMRDSVLSIDQLKGIDILPSAVELTKEMLARELGLDPRDAANLDVNIQCADALFAPWPDADAIIGNPPFLDARKITIEHGAAYSARIRKAFPKVPGRADLCVYWFRRAHDQLKPGGHAGLVGTNSIRQNYSRIGGLDYIVSHGGTITDAVSTQIWPGDAVVHVSIVNWVKGSAPGPFTLSTQDTETAERAWHTCQISRINAGLSGGVDLGSARSLRCVTTPKVVFEGQQTGHIGFIVNRKSKDAIAASDVAWSDVIFPYLNGEDLLSGEYIGNPKWVIDFANFDLSTAQKHQRALAHVKAYVYPDWQKKAEHEHRQTGRHRGEHQDRTKTFWILKRRRKELLRALKSTSRYIAVSAVSKRPIFVFLDAAIRPSNALKVFALADDYSFGVVQSAIFWNWIQHKGSSLKGDLRFTPDTAFASFPWPQDATAAQISAVAEAGRFLRGVRSEIMHAQGLSLRELHKLTEQSAGHPLSAAQSRLDAAMRDAYGMPTSTDTLDFLLSLNHSVAAREAAGLPTIGPGIPFYLKKKEGFVTTDCIAGW